ncbi:translation initiation factor IF-3 [Candidatus Roizmanbacteria bacterium RIFCSPLOWO2_02_FULL_39_8]|nr:MAG: translation initiation factor IF-3 [Candidatus Roizmanbacteria bacterium RIFCSPLOWO2_02_FULL_39_8]
MWYTRNDYITAPEVRLIDEAGKQLDVFKREDALAMAREREVDLVLIAPQAKPPVAKLIDFQKFLYQEEKKKKEAKKGIKKSATKDVQLSLFIGQNDLERQLNKAHEFIADGHQVRVKLALRGRELGKKTMAFDLLNKFLAQIPEGQVASEPNFQGRVLLAVVARKKKS